MNLRQSNSILALAILIAACGARAQDNGPASSNSGTTSSANASGTNTTPTSRQSPFYGSVPTGAASAEVLQLSIADAIQRGLKQNLGVLLSTDSQISAHGELWQQRSKLLPSVNGQISENAAQVNLLAEGFGPIAAKFPGFPTIVGPFEFFDVRARATASLFDVNALDNERSAARNEDAAKLKLSRRAGSCGARHRGRLSAN